MTLTAMNNYSLQVLLAFYILIFSLGQLSAAAPIEDGEKKAKNREQPTFRIETGFYTRSDLHHNLENLHVSEVRNHPVTWEVALRMQLFQDTYTFHTPAAPGEFSDKKEIRKPVIYHSVSKLDRYYRRLLRTGELDQQLISDALCLLLDTAIILYHYDTGEIENSLKMDTSPNALIQTFQRVEIIDPPATTH
jgi:hypothetical protein